MLQLHKGSIELKHIVFCFGAWVFSWDSFFVFC
jgi:hypothetical protein